MEITLDRSSTLILVPTHLELRRLAALGGLSTSGGAPALCGFGPIAAAARTAELIARYRPERVLLVGIAGTYAAQRMAIGTAACFDQVAIDGVGAGTGASFVGPRAMGFLQWPGEEGVSPAVEDELPLVTFAGLPAQPLLVTACAAAGSEEQTQLRRERLPRAAAEDMEGYGVALACRLAARPLVIVRGISNQVGSRDPKTWRIDEALAAARQLALDILTHDEPWQEKA